MRRIAPGLCRVLQSSAYSMMLLFGRGMLTDRSWPETTRCRYCLPFRTMCFS